MFFHHAFGLRICSEIELPELISIAPCEGDIKILLGKVSETGLDSPIDVQDAYQVSPGKVWISIPGLARFYVNEGKVVVIDLLPGAESQLMRIYLLGSCFGAIFHQRTLLVIHGNAIRFGDHCVIFSGKSGAGKSTLAAAFHLKGYEVLADDLSVIDSSFQVQPSCPQMKLWRDSADNLGLDISKLHQLSSERNKYIYPLGAGFCLSALPVKALYILNNKEQESALLKTIEGREKLRPILNHTYRKIYVKGLGLRDQYLENCSSLANNIDVIRLTRPSQFFDTDSLIEVIEKDLKSRLSDK